MATKKYEINQLQSDGSLLTLHPATDASIVSYDDGTTALSVTTVQGAIQEIVKALNDMASKTGVTGVKGNAESGYRKGNVNITAANIGAYTSSETDTKISTAISNHNSNSSAHNDIRTKITNDISSHNSNASAHSDIRKLITSAQSKADSAFSLASGRSKAVSFETVAAMTTALKAANSTDYKIGDQIFIKATGTPDYWVTAVNSTKTGTYGYYELQILETSIDLTDYQTKKDERLQTSNKYITGAINELEEKYGLAYDRLNAVERDTSTISTALGTAQTDISNIKNGTTKVGKAAAADTATSATTATTCTGNAATATKLQTARTINVTGAVTGSASFDGSANASITTTLANSGVTAGTYSVVSVNAKGIVTKGAQFIEVGTDTAATAPSSNLAIGGIWFKPLA